MFHFGAGEIHHLDSLKHIMHMVHEEHSLPEEWREKRHQQNFPTRRLEYTLKLKANPLRSRAWARGLRRTPELFPGSLGSGPLTLHLQDGRTRAVSHTFNILTSSFCHCQVWWWRQPPWERQEFRNICSPPRALRTPTWHPKCLRRPFLWLGAELEELQLVSISSHLST